MLSHTHESTKKKWREKKTFELLKKSGRMCARVPRPSSAATVAEAVAFQRVMLERCGDDFARQLVGVVLAPLGLDAEVVGDPTL